MAVAPSPLLLLILAATLAARPLAARPAAEPASDTGLYTLQTFAPRGHAPSAPLDASPASAAGGDLLAAYSQVRSAAFAGWGTRGIHILTRTGIYPQLHDLAAPRAKHGHSRQVTFFRQRVDQWVVNPVPSRRQALIALDQGGDEEFSLRLLDLSDGGTRGLACPPGRVSTAIWNDAGTAFLYSHTPPGTDRWDIRLGRPPHGREPARDTLLLSRPGTWSPMDWTPDGTRAVLQRYVSASESELYVLAVPGVPQPRRDRKPGAREEPESREAQGPPGGGEVTRLLPKEPPQYFDHAVWTRLPGRRDPALAFTSDRDGDNHRLWLLREGKEGSGTLTALTALSPGTPWDVEWVAAGGDRRTLIYSLNEQGVSVLHAVDPGGDAGPERLRGVPRGIIEGVVFHPSGREFGFTVNAAAFPGEAFTYSLAGSRARRWTESETAGLPREGFREPELVLYPTFDSVEAPGAAGTGGGKPVVAGEAAGGSARVPRIIPAWLYTPGPAPPPPPGSRPPLPAPVPVLVSIHGGPELQARAGFDPFVQYLVGQLRIAVLVPNVRGSTGYGKAYQRADDGRLRTGAVRDLGALLDWIATRPDLDARRVAVSGRSYGGFMALAALIDYGDRLRCGISAVGITHFPSFLKETSGYRRDLRRAEYGDERDHRMAFFLDSISPASRLEGLRRPLLLAHGRNDPRVPYAESVRLFEALRARQVPVWLLTFNREGHAFRSEASQRVHYRVMAGFLTREFGPAKP